MAAGAGNEKKLELPFKGRRERNGMMVVRGIRLAAAGIASAPRSLAGTRTVAPAAARAAPGETLACIGGAYAVAPGRALAVAIRLLPARHTSRHSSLQARAFYWRPAKGLSYSYNLFPSKGGVHIHQIALELVARILWSRHRISI